MSTFKVQSVVQMRTSRFFKVLLSLFDIIRHNSGINRFSPIMYKTSDCSQFLKAVVSQTLANCIFAIEIGVFLIIYVVFTTDIDFLSSVKRTDPAETTLEIVF